MHKLESPVLIVIEDTDHNVSFNSIAFGWIIFSKRTIILVRFLVPSHPARCTCRTISTVPVSRCCTNLTPTSRCSTGAGRTFTSSREIRRVWRSVPESKYFFSLFSYSSTDICEASKFPQNTFVFLVVVYEDHFFVLFWATLAVGAKEVISCIQFDARNSYTVSSAILLLDTLTTREKYQGSSLRIRRRLDLSLFTKSF